MSPVLAVLQVMLVRFCDGYIYINAYYMYKRTDNRTYAWRAIDRLINTMSHGPHIEVNDAIHYRRSTIPGEGEGNICGRSTAPVEDKLHDITILSPAGGALLQVRTNSMI